MRIARWLHDGRTHEGIVAGSRVIPFPDGVTVASLLTRGLEAALAVGRALQDAAGTPLADVHLLAPAVPTTIRDFVAFEEHVEGVSVAVDGGGGGVAPEWYRYPTFYFTNPLSVLGPGDTVTPPDTQALDFELEVAAVIGAPARDGSNLTPAEGAAAIFG